SVHTEQPVRVGRGGNRGQLSGVAARGGVGNLAVVELQHAAEVRVGTVDGGQRVARLVAVVGVLHQGERHRPHVDGGHHAAGAAVGRIEQVVAHLAVRAAGAVVAVHPAAVHQLPQKDVALPGYGAVGLEVVAAEVNVVAAPVGRLRHLLPVSIKVVALDVVAHP